MTSYLGKMWACRYFWLSLVRNDLRSRYRRSIIGVGWSLVRPLLLTMILCVVFVKLFRRTDVWTYAPYLLSGLALWDYLVTSAKQGCHCFFQGESYIRQHPTPVAIFPLRTALAETFHFLIGLLVLFALAWFVNGFGNVPALFSLVPTVMMLFVLAWAVALVTGFANVYFQDTQHLCDVGFQILFYATPIVYDVRDLGSGKLAWLIGNCNPLVVFLRLMREPILYGRVPTLETYALGLTTTLVVAVMAVTLCAKLQRRLIFQL